MAELGLDDPRMNTLQDVLSKLAARSFGPVGYLGRRETSLRQGQADLTQ
jgi:hypothetical protein